MKKSMEKKKKGSFGRGKEIIQILLVIIKALYIYNYIKNNKNSKNNKNNKNNT